MIDKLRKKLTLIFIFSIMSLFTITFCIIIKKDIAKSGESEYENFRKATTHILFDMDIDNINNMAHSSFSFYEQTDSIAFQLEDNKSRIIYKTDSAYIPELTDILTVLKSKTEKESVESLVNTKIFLSGIFPFIFKNHSYMGIYCDLTTSDMVNYTLYIVKQDTSFASFIANNAKMYILIWFSMLFITIIISYILMKKAAEPTEKAMKSQKNFVAAASHELKAPLAVIMTNAEAIETDSKFDKHLLPHITAIDSEILRMSNLVQDLLLLSSIDANTWGLNKSGIDICTLILTIYEKFEPLCKKNSMELELTLVDDVFPEFMADENRLEQILDIFLDNAIHYGHAGTSIKLAVHSETKWIVFTIQDHGIGINDADKPFIYDRFYQTDKSRTNTQHYGLGLSVAKELIEMHKGKIELLDTPGGGCTFKIYFPITK